MIIKILPWGYNVLQAYQMNHRSFFSSFNQSLTLLHSRLFQVFMSVVFLVPSTNLVYSCFSWIPCLAEMKKSYAQLLQGSISWNSEILKFRESIPAYLVLDIVLDLTVFSFFGVFWLKLGMAEWSYFDYQGRKYASPWTKTKLSKNECK